MASGSRAVVFFLLLLAGAEAERIHVSASIAAASRARIGVDSSQEGAHTSDANTDLDWAGCGGKLWNPLSASGCSEVDGCEKQKLWLDTPRQSCRFSDAHKLQPENVPKFLPVELERLVQKSATFEKHGCLFARCYRRMLQIIRLLKYVRVALSDAKKEPSHPAHALATSSETLEKMNRVTANLAGGLRKWEAKNPEGNLKTDFGGAFADLQSMGDRLRDVPAEEKGARENVAVVEAMLKVVGTSLDEGQRAELYEQVEGAGSSEDISEEDLDGVLKDMVSPLDEVMSVADSEDRANLEVREKGVADEDDPEDVAANAADAKALVQIDQQLGSNSTGAVQSRGTGPLKWLFKNGLGWIVTRVAWTLLFLAGTIFGLIRATVIFPLLFLTCTLSKFLIWVFRDVGYNLLWEGEYGLVKNRFVAIGKCAPGMWDLVGFDSSADNTVNQIFMDPARFASHMTGVHHWYKNSEDLCKKVTCGARASCKNGQCICDYGFYPDAGSPGVCSAPTQSGCRCKASWIQVSYGVFSKHHYGCPAEGKCQVDQLDPTYGTCKSRLKSRVSSGFKGWLGLKGNEQKDLCAAGPNRAVVAPISKAAPPLA